MSIVVKSYNETEKRLRQHKNKGSRKKQKSGPKIPKDFQVFNRLIGYPTNPTTKKPQKMTSYQVQFYETIENHHKVLVVKSRQIGITEAGLRSIALNCFHRYKGYKIIIIAGNELRIAKQMLLRFDNLFANKPGLGYAFKELGKNGRRWTHDEIISDVKLGSEPEIVFSNGTRVMCFPASKQRTTQAVRGMSDVVCVYFTEAAHTGVLDDQPIMNAIEPLIAQRKDGDLILESTPNGKRGAFYKYVTDVKEGKDSSWKLLEFDYLLGLENNILSKKYIEKQKQSKQVNFEQEYNIQFASSSNAVFSAVDFKYLADDWEVYDLRKLIGKVSVKNN